MSADQDVAAVVLAAGSGRRFAAAGGLGPKLLSDLDGRPLLVHVLDLAVASGLRPVIVVLPPAVPDLVSAVDARPGVEVVVNAAASDGLSTSVLTGLRSLSAASPPRTGPAPGACVLLLADQPAIDPEVLAQVIGTWRRSGRPVRVRYDDGPGHPVLLPRPVWGSVVERLSGADGDAREHGAGPLLAGLGVVEVRVPGPAPVDVDVPGDLTGAGEGTGPELAG